MAQPTICFIISTFITNPGDVMSSMILAAFSHETDADAALSELEKLGYKPQDISVISKDNKGSGMQHVKETVAEKAITGATSGAATGTAIGGIAGLLAGAGVLPALAGILIGGPIAVALGATGIIATTISGAVTGAVAGGLIGGLTKLGVSEDTARYYDETISAGGILLAVPSMESSKEKAEEILRNHSAQQIKEISMQ
jgi:uncharacterized membrane protein